MALDLAALREKLLARRADLLAEDVLSAEGRAPVTLEQDSVGRLSRAIAGYGPCAGTWVKGRARRCARGLGGAAH